MSHSSSMEAVLTKLTTRNILALSVTATVLTVILQMTFNASQMLVILQDNTEWVIGGAFVFGVVFAKWGDIILFYFRKPQAKESDK